ncbi:ATP-grasp fold amidoligase family protein, partial [Pontibacter locisalis]
IMINIIQRRIQKTLSKLTQKEPQDNGDFAKRIIYRHKVFWSDADAELVRNSPLYEGITIEQLKSTKHWQRKLSNKYNARVFAQKFGCRVPQLYWKGRDLKELSFRNLPDQYVIRPTIGHSCKMVFLMDKHMNHMDSCFYSDEQLKDVMQETLDKNSHQEFLIEEFLRSEKGEYKIPVDYKLSLFNGELAVIDVINRMSPKTGLSSCYDENWNMIECIGKQYQRSAYQAPPACLPEIINWGKKLSKAYEIFVRIDFYATDKGAVFGEFTPTPGKGNGFTPEADIMLLNYWDKFCCGQI